MQVSNRVTVVARNVSKTFFPQKTLLSLGAKRRNIVQAVQPLSFVACEGDSIGLIGSNGSGKSTLLNMISGSEVPTTGEILVSEQPTMLSVAAVLQSELTGWQNVRLGLLAKGLSKAQVNEIWREVGEWSSIGDALDRPYRSYSSGMRARLKFAIATAVPTEILLVDEALGTGDASFSAKATRRMQGFLEQAGSIFLVSHSANTIKTQCNRAIWLEQGVLIADGEVDMIVDAYSTWSDLVSKEREEEANAIISELQNCDRRTTVVFDDEAQKALS